MKVLVKDRSPVVQGVVVEAPRERWQVVTSARDLLIGAPVTWAAFQIIAYDERRRHGLSVAVMEMKRKAEGQRTGVTGNVTTARAFQAGQACTPMKTALKHEAFGPGFQFWLCYPE